MTSQASDQPVSIYPYRHVAWCYDMLAKLYSLSAIDRSKAWHIDLIEPGMRVLYAGAGTGREVALALEQGAAATCIEPCAAMARRLRANISPWAERCTILPTRLENLAHPGRFDLVVGHYFLNLFDQRAMAEQLDRLIGLTAPGGRVVIGDFALPARDRRWRRLLHHAYYRPLNVAGCVLGICALHPIYDYASRLESHGLSVERRVGFGVVPGGPAFYEVVCARKKRGG